MTRVRGFQKRVDRKDVIGDVEFSAMMQKAEENPEKFYRLRTKALLAILRLTGKRRSELARLELSDLKIEKPLLNITFTLSKKRKKSIITKRSTKAIPLKDPLTKPILEYIDYLETLDPTPKFFFPRTRSLWKQDFVIISQVHISGRQIFNLVRQVSPLVWCHLFRETVASDVVKSDPSIIGAFKVQRRLDLARVETGFNYVRRFAADIISREINGGDK